ncbi:MAG: hypothetical protein WC821_04480 [archaeon]|jgi:hypothetical protein
MPINRNIRRVRGQLTIAGKNKTILQQARAHNKEREDLISKFSAHLRSANRETKERNEAMRKWGYGDSEEICADNRRLAAIRSAREAFKELKKSKKPKLP